MIIIGNSGIDSLTSGATTSVGGADSQAAANAKSSSSSDSVSLSNAASLVALAKAAVWPEHQAKLQNISSQVNAGQYEIDNAEISRGVVASHLQQ
jgi:hypothetical protein